MKYILQSRLKDITTYLLMMDIKNFEASNFKSAGVLLYDNGGFWLGKETKRNKKNQMQSLWCDYGGKREGTEKPFETARRECKEECGIDINDYTLTEMIYHPSSNSKHVIFMVCIPPNVEPEIKEGFEEKVKATFWDSDDESIHPRLRFDKGFLIHKKLQEMHLWDKKSSPKGLLFSPK